MKTHTIKYERKDNQHNPAYSKGDVVVNGTRDERVIYGGQTIYRIVRETPNGGLTIDQSCLLEKLAKEMIQNTRLLPKSLELRITLD